jgi:hypothetical protein
MRPGNGWFDSHPRPLKGVGLVIAVFGLAIVAGMVIGVTAVLAVFVACPGLHP